MITTWESLKALEKEAGAAEVAEWLKDNPDTRKSAMLALAAAMDGMTAGFFLGRDATEDDLTVVELAAELDGYTSSWEEEKVIEKVAEFTIGRLVKLMVKKL